MEQGNLVLNPKYYMGYLPVLGPIVIPGDDASSQPAVSKGELQYFFMLQLVPSADISGPGQMEILGGPPALGHAEQATSSHVFTDNS